MKFQILGAKYHYKEKQMAYTKGKKKKGMKKGKGKKRY